jgi:hypothetical protein
MIKVTVCGKHQARDWNPVVLPKINLKDKNILPEQIDDFNVKKKEYDAFNAQAKVYDIESFIRADGVEHFLNEHIHCVLGADRDAEILPNGKLRFLASGYKK